VISLLAAKLHIPSLPLTWLVRPRLLDRLEEGRRQHKRLTLVAAPAGYGKTLLLAGWIRECAVPAVWLALDDGDNDAPRFLTYVATALHSIVPPAADEAVALLQSSRSVSIEPALTILANALGAVDQPWVFVLDDYHLIQAGAVHEAVHFLLDHLPPSGQLVLATRSDPPLPVARLRARGQLNEIRQADLCFTAEEAASFLNRAVGYDFPAADAQALAVRTEGWAAGLQLAVLSLQGQSDMAAFIRNFTGSHRYIMDYLLEEALQRQSPEVQDFLLRTSILERFCASLCTSLFDSILPSSQEILEYLEAVNLFIIPLDDARHWYRYHTLFAELLRERLVHRMDATQRADLHLRAGAWFAANGWIAEAIDHALAGEDYAAATLLIEQNAGDFLWQQGRFRWVRQWASAFPDAWVALHPALRVIKAVALSAGGEMSIAEGHLRAIEDEVQQTPAPAAGWDDVLGQVALTRAHLAAARHDVAETIEWCHQALSRIRPTDFPSRGLIFMLLGGSYYARGELSAAEQALQESMRLMLSTDQHVAVLFSLGLLSQVDLKRGALRRAASRRDQAVTFVPQAESISAMGVIYLTLGEVLRQWNDLDGAYRCLTHGLELYRAPEEIISQRHTLGGYLSLAKIYQARGDLVGAAAVLADAERFFSLAVIEPDNGESLTVAHVWLQLAQGDLESAGRWAQEYVARYPSPIHRELSLALYTASDLMIARVYLARQQWDAAISWLVDLQDHPDLQQCGETLIEINLLTALAEQGRGRIAPALEALECALNLAREENYCRIFLDAGPSMLLLFRALLKNHFEDPYFQRILAAFEAEIELIVVGVDKPVEKGGVIHTLRDLDALSERELEVLRLMAEGLSNPEIARKLIVTEGTIKTHTHHIYSKLSVRNRTEALNRARELNLL